MEKEAGIVGESGGGMRGGMGQAGDLEIKRGEHGQGTGLDSGLYSLTPGPQLKLHAQPSPSWAEDAR